MNKLGESRKEVSIPENLEQKYQSTIQNAYKGNVIKGYNNSNYKPY